MFFRSGLLKVNSWEFTVQLFRDEYKVPLLDPLIAARIATSIELGVPVLLFLGLATRLATLPLLGMIAVIQIFVYPNAWSDHLLWSAALCCFSRAARARSRSIISWRRRLPAPRRAWPERAAPDRRERSAGSARASRATAVVVSTYGIACSTKLCGGGSPHCVLRPTSTGCCAGPLRAFSTSVSVQCSCTRRHGSSQ